MNDRHPAIEHFAPYFEYEHLPPFLQEISKRFHSLAQWLVMNDALQGAELTASLRKLLEAKDAAVRSAITSDKTWDD